MDSNETTPSATTASIRPLTNFEIIIFTLHCLEALVIIGGNFLTLLAVKRTKVLGDNPTNTFVFSLALVDGLIGVLIPFIVAVHVSDDLSTWKYSACIIRGPYYAVVPISLSTLLAIAIDRYLAVVHPLSYRRTMTKRAASIASAAIWITLSAIMLSTTCYYGLRQSSEPAAAQDIFPKALLVVFVQVMILCPLLGNIVLYILIYVSLSRRRAIGVVAARSSQQGAEAPGRQVSKRTRSFTKMMSLVLGYLIFAWLPYYVLVPLYKLNDPATPRWYFYVFNLSIVLFYSNSFMNPVIYSWKNKDYREAYIKILKCGRQTATTPGNESTITEC